MARQPINIGSLPNDGTGDKLRISFNKVNQNFGELYANTSNTDSKVSNLFTVANAAFNAANNTSIDVYARSVANAAFDKANGVSVGANNYAGFIANSVNVYTAATYATQTALSSNILSTNNYASAYATSIGASSNGWANVIAYSANNYAGAMSNTALVTAQAAFNKANTGPGGAAVLANGSYTVLLDSAGTLNLPINSGTSKVFAPVANTLYLGTSSKYIQVRGADGAIVFPNSTVKNASIETISSSNQTYHSGGGAYTCWTATSADIIAAKVTVRIQSDMNIRTEIFTVTIAKDAANVNYSISDHISSSNTYGASTISAGKDINGNLYVSHTDPNGFGNGYTLSVVEFSKTW